MIPEKKKTPEEIAALREGLGIPGSLEKPKQNPAHPPVQPTSAESEALPIEDSPEPDAGVQSDEPVIALDVPSVPAAKSVSQFHSLRKHELPLAPAPALTRKTELPARRHDTRDMAQIRKREALAKLNSPGTDPAAHLRKQTAHPVLYIPGYLLAVAAAAVAFQRVHFITPIVLLALSLAITIYMAIRKPRSRHHAALIFILIFLTAAFGGLHYAPLFRNVP